MQRFQPTPIAMTTTTLIACLIFQLVIANGVRAQEADELDLSRYQIVEEGERIRSFSEVNKLEDDYKELVAAGDCNAALVAIASYYDAANVTANILRQGLEPFYDASRDDRESVFADRQLLDELAAAEDLSNDLVRRRNTAWVEEAKCLLAIGDRRAAIVRLYRALDFIGTSSDQRELWNEARSLLWAQIGYSP